jgi:hypothetical protein
MFFLRLISCAALSLIVSAQMDQIPLTPPVVLQSNSRPTLADLLTVDSSLSIFYSYARELELSAIFSDNSYNSTLLAPTNKAVMSLARKPYISPILFFPILGFANRSPFSRHQNPSSSPSIPNDATISENEFDQQSRQNVLRWVSAHIIPVHSLVLCPRLT